MDTAQIQRDLWKTSRTLPRFSYLLKFSNGYRESLSNNCFERIDAIVPGRDLAFWLRRILNRELPDSLNLTSKFITCFPTCSTSLRIVENSFLAVSTPMFATIFSRFLRSTRCTSSWTSPNSKIQQDVVRRVRDLAIWFSRCPCWSQNRVNNSPMWTFLRFKKMYGIYQDHTLDVHIVWDLIRIIVKVSRTIVLKIGEILKMETNYYHVVPKKRDKMCTRIGAVHFT